MSVKARTKQKKKLNINWVDIDILKPYANNAKIHSKSQVKKIATSISEFGFINPIIIDIENNLIAGHGRLEAAKHLSMAEIPTMRAEHLTPAQVKAFRLADNRLAEDANWDEQLLAIEIESLTLEAPNLAISLTGFEMGEIDVILSENKNDENSQDADPLDVLPDIDTTAIPISKPGEVWELGEHRLICGNALEPASYDKLMNSQTASLIFTDPPFNVPIAGHVSGNGKIKHREFAMATGEMTSSEFSAFLQKPLSLSAKASRDGAIHYICMDWRHMPELMQAGDAVYTELKNLCVWVKSNGGMGSYYRSRHELVFVYKHGTAPHINNVQLGQYGRNRTNVWEYPGVNSFGKDRDSALAMHPTVKPMAMVKDAILDSSNRGDIILDPFLGSGTTLIAAHQSGRRGYGIEIDPLYVDTIIRRWQNLSGQQAKLANGSELFDDRQALALGGSHEQ